MAEGSEEAGLALGAGAGQPDLVLLSPLTEDAVLHNLLLRYKKGIIYTYVGNVLISMNPERPLPLYSPELLRSYLQRPPYTLPPHIYAVAATAYRWVRDRNENQLIVITGESGSGKTEAARICLQCAVVAGTGSTGARLAAAGTLLEAFGNAATRLNHNASRFGKLLDIEFDFKGDLVGGHVVHYLLESERARRVNPNERNFHIMYQLLAGADVQLLKSLKLHRGWEQYRLLRPAGSCACACQKMSTHAHCRGLSHKRGHELREQQAAAAAQRDMEHFQFTKAAFRTLGLGAWALPTARLVAFLLKLGNVRLESAAALDGTLSHAVHRSSRQELEEACALVGVRPEGIICGAAEPLFAHEHAQDYEEECEEWAEACNCAADSSSSSGVAASADTDAEAGAEADADWARAHLDRLISAIYCRLFTWLVNSINEAIKITKARSELVRVSTLGVLDMYGLESLAHNGLERLCINYAMERVAAAARRLALNRVRDAARGEGLAAEGGALATDRADLLDLGPECLLGVIRECSAAGADAPEVLRRLRNVPSEGVFVRPPHHFQVAHAGARVTYSAMQLSRDNRSAASACRRASAALRRASCPLLAALFSRPTPTGSGSPRRAAWASCRQRAQMTALARRIRGENAREVRCLAVTTPTRAEADAALRAQVSAHGIVELGTWVQTGWCECISAKSVLSRYSILVKSTEIGSYTSPIGGARALLRRLPIPVREFAFGRNSVLVRSPRTLWELEAWRAARVKQLVRAAQKAWRAFLLKRRHKAQIVLARAWRKRRPKKMVAAKKSRASVDLVVQRKVEACKIIWRWWVNIARRHYLFRLASFLEGTPNHTSPCWWMWPVANPAPALLAPADNVLRTLHHSWRCRLFRDKFDQTARNRMREKVTASVLFAGRKASYAWSVGAAFAGDYAHLRAAPAWRRAHRDHYLVFADTVLKVSSSGRRLVPTLLALSPRALLLLEPTSLRVRRRVSARRVHSLAMSPFEDDLLLVRVQRDENSESDSEPEETSQCSARETSDVPGCLFGSGSSARRGDVLCWAPGGRGVELATKLYLVVAHAAERPAPLLVAPRFAAALAAGPRPTSVHVHVHPSHHHHHRRHHPPRLAPHRGALHVLF